jgi:hypothetical protein
MRKLVLYLGCLLVGVAAAWASFSTLAELAAASGWKSGDWLLPTSIDALGAMSCWVWLTPIYSPAARSFARRTTFTVILVSVIGNGVGHVVSSGMLPAGVLLIVLVGAVPPSSLAAVIHLLVLVTAVPVPDAAPVPAAPAPAKKKAAPKPTPKPSPVKSGPESGAEVDDVLMQRARHADRDHQAKNGGRPISRDALKDELKIGTGKATDLLAALKKEREVA